LLEASKKGYLVPEAMKQSVLNNLRWVARNWKPATSYYMDSEETTQAYRLYVLALAGSPEMGAMNRLKEMKDLASMSRWSLASAYALVGREDVAQDLISKTTALPSGYSEYDETFGSDVRDQSIQLMTLCLLDKGKEAATLVKNCTKKLYSDDW